MYDCVVVGAGPAGMSASIYLARQKLNFIVISKDIGGQTLLSSDVENYLGFHFINGIELVAKFLEHMNDYKIEIREEEVREVQKINETKFRVVTDAAEYESRTVLIATGKKPKKLNVPGEDELYGKGVTYCATCDAPLFAKKDVAVVGGGNSAMDAALLAEKYSDRVYLATINKNLVGDRIMMEKVNMSRKIEVIYNAKTKKITGRRVVEGIIIEVEGSERTIPVQGVFIEIGLIPSSNIINIVRKNEWGEIKLETRNFTDIPGIFAAGDVTEVAEKQIIVASGEGAKAALDVIEFLTKHRISY